MPKRTPLFEQHQIANGKIVDFAGWELPVRYTSTIEEHQAVRTNWGIFDASHMGEIWVRGANAQAALQYWLCNDLSSLKVGGAQYSAILNPQGGVVDDVIVYKFSDQIFLLCVNASNTEKDWKWFNAHNTFKASLENVSSQFGQIAVQGPKAIENLARLDPHFRDVDRFRFVELEIMGIPVIAARTGYTGEDGFEIFIPAERTATIWQALIKQGAQPCGLGARDTLRLEAAYPLHGHELTDERDALSSGLSWIVKQNKPDFIGKTALQSKSAGQSQLCGFFVTDPGIVREGSVIQDESGNNVGIVTSGTKTPSLELPIVMGVVKKESQLKPLFALVRDRKIALKLTKLPFYSGLKK